MRGVSAVVVRLVVAATVVAAAVGCGSDTADPPVNTAAQTLRVSYGADPDNYGILHVPEGEGPYPVVVLVHGGGWAEQHDLSYFEPLAESLVAEDVAVWNFEYRRVGGAGGWPITLADADGEDRAAYAAGLRNGVHGNPLALPPRRANCTCPDRRRGISRPSSRRTPPAPAAGYRTLRGCGRATPRRDRARLRWLQYRRVASR